MTDISKEAVDVPSITTPTKNEVMEIMAAAKARFAREMCQDHPCEFWLSEETLRAGAYIEAQAARIAELEAALETARAGALREAAEWHHLVAQHDAEGMEYSSLVGIPISNWSELDTSVKTHEWCARAILAMIKEPKP